MHRSFATWPARGSCHIMAVMKRTNGGLARLADYAGKPRARACVNAGRR